MATKKKTVVEKTTEDIATPETMENVSVDTWEPVKPVATPKKEVKERTYDELVVLSREEYLAVEKDIREGKATVKPQ